MMDSKYKQNGLSVLVLSLGMGLGASGGAQADTMGYLTDGYGAPVLTGYGECWKALGGTQEKFEACGDVMEKPAEPAPAPPPPPAGPKDSDGDGVYDHLDKCPGTRRGAKVDANGCEIIPNVTIDLVNDEFDFDSAKLKPAMEDALSDLAARVKATPGEESLTIVGHTDSTGPDAYNMQLSIRRAQAVADFLAAKGISREVMTIEGKGETEPVADNKTRAGRAKNRRVEIKTK